MLVNLRRGMVRICATLFLWLVLVIATPFFFVALMVIIPFCVSSPNFKDSLKDLEAAVTVDEGVEYYD